MTIEKLTDSDPDQILLLFGDQLTDYYFLANDLLHKTVSDPIQIFGEFIQGNLVSVLLGNAENITYFSPQDREIDVYLDVLNDLSFVKFSGPSRHVRKFLPHIQIKHNSLSYMGVVENVAIARKFPEIQLTTITNQEDIGSTAGRTIYMEKNGQIISSCSTIKEGEKSAIVTGVFTHSEYRNKGFGTEVLIELFNTLLVEGKYPYLFYSNPQARSVYQRIGMKEVCEWQVLLKEIS